MQTLPLYPECPASASCVLMLPPDFMALSVTDGAQLGFAVGAVWAVAWGFRALATFFTSTAEPTTD